MTIPQFEQTMLPLLKLASDDETHQIRKAVETLGENMKLSPDEMRELVPTGVQTRFYNRVTWARTHLKWAGLLEDPKFGHFKITDIGHKFLARNPEEINIKILSELEEYRNSRNLRSNEEESPSIETNTTPTEIIQSAYQELRDKLADELLEYVTNSPPEFFERLVVDLLLRMGYGGSRQEAGRAIGRSHDGGIDGIINEDRLGLDVIYIQAKRFKDTKVSFKDVTSFVGALVGKRSKKGVFITTSKFTSNAINYVDGISENVILIDGPRLADLMIEYGLGVKTDENYELKSVDVDYFPEFPDE